MTKVFTNPDEEFVRANWVHVVEGVITVYLGDCESRSYCATLPGWSAAAEFTRERLEQIRQLNEEIVTARQMFNYTSHFIGEPVGRILALLESALADLKHGMRSDRTADLGATE